MIQAVHHVRGRLRIHHLGIKWDSRYAARYCDVVRCLPGVYAATARASTGGVVIEYDPAVTSQAELCQLLGARALRGTKAGEKLVEKLGQALVERLIERALIAALI